MRTLLLVSLIWGGTIGLLTAGEPRLSGEQVVKLADGEMWTRCGNDVFTSYTRLGPLYLPAAHAWEVRYRRKPSEKIDAPAIDPHRDAPLASDKPGTAEEELVVTIDDTTGFASLNLGSQKHPAKNDRPNQSMQLTPSRIAFTFIMISVALILVKLAFGRRS